MKFNLKTVILLSSLLAGLLNLWQYSSAEHQRKEAFAPAQSLKTAPSTPGPTITKATTQPVANTSTETPPHTSTPTSAPTEIAAASKLSAAGLNPGWAGLYLSVSQQTGVPWQLLAAVHRVETGQAGTTTRTSYAGATGPMQFMPATFRAYGIDGNNDGVKDIHNIDDAMLSAGRYLAANGAARGQYNNALYRYNHSQTYVNKVLGIARQLGL